MSFDSSTCQQQFAQGIHIFEAVVFFSLSLSIVLEWVRAVCKHKFNENPGTGSKVLWSFSAIKLLFGILLLTVLNPKCPDGCSCGSYTGIYYYPSVVVLISALWAAIGYKYHALQQQQGQSDGSNDSTTIPSVEIVITVLEIIINTAHNPLNHLNPKVTTTMSSDSTCQQQFAQEKHNFEKIVFFSLSLATVLGWVRAVCKHKFNENPGTGSKILWSFSAIKLLFGILLFTALNPKCPDGCSCGSYTRDYYYASVFVLISAYWAALGYKYHALQQQQGQSDGSNNSTTIPSVEIV